MHRITKVGERLVMEKYQNSALGEGWFPVEEMTFKTSVTDFLSPTINPLTQSASVQVHEYKLIITPHKKVHLHRSGTDLRGSSRWEPTETVPFDVLISFLRWANEKEIIDFAEISKREGD